MMVKCGDTTRRTRHADVLESELSDYRQRFERLVGNLNGMAYRCANDASYTMVYLSIGVKTLTGYCPEQLIGNRDIAYGELIHPDDRPMVWEGIQAALAEHRGFRLTYRIRHISGNLKWVWEQGCGLYDQTGTAVAMEGYITDISELKERETRYRSLFDNNHAVMLLVDPEQGDIVDANPAACHFYGWSRRELVQKKMADIHTAPLEQVNMELAAAVAEQRRHFLTRHRLIDGSIRDVEVFSGPIPLSGRRLLYSIVHDITARRKVETALRQSETKFRLTFDASPDAANVNRLADGVYIDVNAGFIRMTGYTRKEVIGRSFLEVDIWRYSGGRQKLMEELRESGRFENLKVRFHRRDGTVGTGLMSARTILIDNTPHFITFTRDISEQIELRDQRQKLQDQLHQAQRLESVGRLAGGVAHDFNNLLSIILGYSELLLEPAHDHRADHESLQEIHGAAMRARDLTRQLLAFSRKQILTMKPVDLNAVVTGFERLLRRVLGEDIALELNLASKPLIVKADPAQLEQVLMNLAVNARDAILDRGTVAIETGMVMLDDDYAENKPGVMPGEYGMIAVSDTGGGIDKKTLDLIFEPFFTTKSKDKGTGLGLATAFGIVKQHGGAIWVYSEPGQGSTFKVYLPLCSEEPAGQRSKATDNRAAGSETIMVVEDDPAVRRLVVGILSHGGYQVIETDSAEDAVQRSLQIGGPIDLVLTDVVMPGMKGKDVFSSISEYHPESKVLYMSGYTDKMIARQGISQQGTQFIQKPFSVNALLAKLRRVLDEDKAD